MPSNENEIKGIIDNYDSLNSFLQSSADSVSALDACWIDISLGGSHTAAIKTDGTLWTWGTNSQGQLGDGTAVTRCSPGTVVGSSADWCQVSNGSSHTAAIKSDGTLWTWGYNAQGRLGDGTAVTRCSPRTVAGGGTTWCCVSSGNSSTVAIKTDGTLWTWGTNSQGQLGDGTTVSRCSPGTIWGSYTTWCQASGGTSIIAAIKTDGTLWTWGNNSTGQLGDGTQIARSSPGTVAGGGTWCRVSSIYRHSAAIKTDGTLWTWGWNISGRLGDGTTVCRSSPGTVAGGGTNWCQVDGGGSDVGNHTVAIKTDGTLWTWGCNPSGQLGDGTTVNKCSPGTVAGGGTNWCQVSNSCCNTLAIKCDGTLWSWGYNNQGKLGDGTTVDRCSPGSILFPTTTSQEFLLLASTIDQISEHRQVSVASTDALPDLYKGELANGHIIFVEDRNLPVISNNECWVGLDGRVLRSDAPTRTLFSWGGNSFGELGDGTTVCRSSPGTIAGGGTTWCQISRDAAIKTDGTLWTWGCNGQGQLGDGTTVSRCSPGTVFGGGTNWCQVVSSLFGTAAIKEDGTLWTWGAGISIGSNSITARCSPGTVAAGGTTWCQISAFNGAFAAIKTDGTLWTWGCNGQGRLGDGTIVARSSPVTTSGGGNTWCKVTAGPSHAIAIKTDGTLWTWGCNNSGQLGEGTTVSRSSPGSIFGDDNDWCYIGGMGSFHSAAIKTDGTLWTWGSNNFGELGNGTTVSRCSPGTVFGGGTTWCKFSMTTNAGGIAAIKTDGTLWTWGQNQVGLTCGFLGDGTTVARCSPGTIAGGGTQWQEVMFGDCFSLALKVS